MKKIFYLLCAFAFFQTTLFSAEPNLHICTVASQHTKGLDQLLDSCDRYGISIDVLGLGKKFRGLSHKLIYVKKYIQNLHDNDVVLFVDAYDVLFFATEDKIMKTFLRMRKPFIISVERYCWPYSDLEPHFPRGPTSNRYINSGSFMGYVYRLKEILTDINPRPYEDDQGLFTLHYFKHPDLYTFDAHCKLFLPMAGIIMYELKLDYLKKNVALKETGIKPCLIHGNGGSRPMYQEIYDEFYLEDSDSEDAS